MIDIYGIFSMLIGVVILVLIAWLILYIIEWAVGKLGLPAPIIVIARVVVAILALAALAGMLTGHPVVVWNPR